MHYAHGLYVPLRMFLHTLCVPGLTISVVGCLTLSPAVLSLSHPLTICTFHFHLYSELCTFVPIYIIHQVYFKVFCSYKPCGCLKTPQQVGRAQLGQCGRAAACVSMCGGLHDFIMSVIILIQSHTTTFE